MNHCCHNHDKTATGNLKLAFVLNFLFTIVEIVGGLATNSVAIYSDALHDLGDTLSLGIAWLLQKLSSKQKDKKFSYGYRRLSLAGSLINCFVLIIGSVVILAEAIPRLINPQTPHAPGMLALSMFGIAVNSICVFRLSNGKTLNERVVYLHLIEDVLGWLAVFIVSIILMFKDIPILDPILSILITSWVLYHVMGNLKKTSFVFLQGVPAEISIENVEKKIVNINHVKNVHHTHIWSLDGEMNVLTVHVVIDDLVDKKDLIAVKQQVKSIGNDMGIEHMTIEVEFSPADCSHFN